MPAWAASAASWGWRRRGVRWWATWCSLSSTGRREKGAGPRRLEREARRPSGSRWGRGVRAGWSRRGGRRSSGRWRGRDRRRRRTTPAPRRSGRSARTPARRPSSGDARPGVGDLERTTSPCRSAAARSTSRRRRRASGGRRSRARLATTWCTRSGSASTTRSGGSTATSTGCPARGARHSSAASSRSSRTTERPPLQRHGAGLQPAQVEQLGDQATEPLDLLQHRRGTSRDRAASTPSTRFSSTACSALIGVRSSWLTLATRSRRSRSTSLELGGHGVEGAGELADLVVATSRVTRRPCSPLAIAAAAWPSPAAARSCPGRAAAPSRGRGRRRDRRATPARPVAERRAR